MPCRAWFSRNKCPMTSLASGCWCKANRPLTKRVFIRMRSLFTSDGCGLLALGLLMKPLGQSTEQPNKTHNLRYYRCGSARIPRLSFVIFDGTKQRGRIRVVRGATTWHVIIQANETLSTTKHCCTTFTRRQSRSLLLWVQQREMADAMRKQLL
jgi:hypothetical protein